MNNKEFNGIVTNVLDFGTMELMSLNYSLQEMILLKAIEACLSNPYDRGSFKAIAMIAKIHQVDVIKIAQSTLIRKGVEYSANDDRLHNFKIDFTGTSPIKVLEGYALKHLKWCVDYIRGDVNGSKEMIEEHFGDLYNYMILATAILIEEVPCDTK